MRKWIYAFAVVATSVNAGGSLLDQGSERIRLLMTPAAEFQKSVQFSGDKNLVIATTASIDGRNPRYQLNEHAIQTQDLYAVFDRDEGNPQFSISVTITYYGEGLRNYEQVIFDDAAGKTTEHLKANDR